MPTFREEVEKGKGCAVILAGSGSDNEHVKKITDALCEYEIPHEVRIASAHKQSSRLTNIIKEYDSWEGPLVYIAVAGAVDALSGLVSFISKRPTISCPPDHPNLTCINNPSGSSNAYVGNPKNAARFVAQMYSSINPACAKLLSYVIESKRTELEDQDKKLRAEYAARQGLDNGN